jgi:hypothetical protein
MRGYTQGGRFDDDFETNDVLTGIDVELKNPVGTHALWYVYDPVHTVVDPVYDVGYDPTYGVGGKVWTGPYKLPVVRAVITQGKARTSAVGYYNSDELHLTLNAEDVERISPGVINNPDLQNRGRIVWKNQVYRPYGVQQRGIVSERYTLIVVDCIQLMPEEMVNDPQFADFTTRPL